MASITEMMHQCIVGKPTPSIEIDEEQKKQKQDNTTNDLEQGSGAGYDDFLQFIKSGSEDDFMDNKDNKSTWNNFTKYVLWGTVAVILVLVIMAIFLM